MVAHFDGKLLPDNDGGLVDRMPIVVSGLHVEKLLSIPKLPISTGQIMGDAVVQALRDWKDQRNLIYYKARMLITQEYAVFAHCFRLRAKHLLCICVAWQIFTA